MLDAVMDFFTRQAGYISDYYTWVASGDLWAFYVNYFQNRF